MLDVLKAIGFGVLGLIAFVLLLALLCVLAAVFFSIVGVPLLIFMGIVGAIVLIIGFISIPFVLIDKIGEGK